MDIEETIAAIASTHEGQGVRGIVRVSGPESFACVRRVFVRDEGRTDFCTRRPQRYEGSLQLGAPLGEVEASLYWWPTARSYTCQPLAEIHTWGAPPLLQSLLDALASDATVIGLHVMTRDGAVVRSEGIWADLAPGP